MLGDGEDRFRLRHVGYVPERRDAGDGDLAGGEPEALGQRQQDSGPAAAGSSRHGDDVARLGSDVQVAEKPSPMVADSRSGRGEHRHDCSLI
jgi:hypothetical protein